MTVLAAEHDGHNLTTVRWMSVAAQGKVKLKVSRAHNDATLASISPDIRCPQSIDTL